MLDFSGCSAAVDIVGRLASYWNIPVCTAAGVNDQFEDRSIYSTLLRLALTINTLGDAITNVIKFFDWHHVVVLSDSSQTFFRQLHKALSPIMRKFQREGYELNRFNREFESKKQPNYTNLLLEGRAHGRARIPPALVIDEVSRFDLVLCYGEWIRRPDRRWRSSPEVDCPAGSYRKSRPGLTATKHHAPFTAVCISGEFAARTLFLLGVDGIVLRQIMLCAYDLGMGNGEYAFIAAKPYTNVRYFGEYTWNIVGDKRNEDARKMYEQLVVISLIMRPSREYKKFVEKVVLKSKAEQIGGHAIDKSIINELLGGFYDCVQLYAWAVNKTLSEGKNPLDGKHLINEILKSTRKDVTISGLTGMLQFNEHGDRMAEYAIQDFNATGQMDIVAMYSSLNKTVTMLSNKSFSWVTGAPPRDVPICGFLGEAPQCRETDSPILLIVITVVTLASFLATAVIALIFYRKMKLETQLANLWWHIKWDEITYPDKQQRKSATSLSINGENNGATEAKGSPVRFPVDSGVPGRFGNVHIGIYKGMKVAVRQLRICKFTTTRSFLLELKQMHDLTHENLVRLIGLTAEDPNVGVVMEYCPRGSLRDLVENESLRLDWTFRYSIINDIVE
ncbi:atrial natriuretic peptide receptor 1-like, partial [Tropilaelaps mercedesae]